MPKLFVDLKEAISGKVRLFKEQGVISIACPFSNFVWEMAPFTREIFS